MTATIEAVRQGGLAVKVIGAVVVLLTAAVLAWLFLPEHREHQLRAMYLRHIGNPLPQRCLDELQDHLAVPGSGRLLDGGSDGVSVPIHYTAENRYGVRVAAYASCPLDSYTGDIDTHRMLMDRAGELFR